MPPPPTSQVNRETYQELCRIGNNVNQLVRQIHEGKVKWVDASVSELFRELQVQIKAVGLQTLGVEPTKRGGGDSR